jgi:hypothetical protein
MEGDAARLETARDEARKRQMEDGRWKCEVM